MNKSKLFSKDFTLVVIGQIISLFGNGIIRFALPLYLLKQTGSSTLFGVVTALSFLSMIILMPIGGMIADRANKRNIMVVLDFSTALLMIALILLLGKVDLVALLIVVLMVLYGIQGAYQPAVQASIPLLQDKTHLLQSNAIINQVNALSGLVAPTLGGVLFGAYGINPIIIIGAGCFLFSAVMEIFICIPHQKVTGNQHVFTMMKDDAKESFSFMKHDKPIILKSILVICLINLFLSSLIIIAMPVLITQTLGLSDVLYGLSQGILALGGLIGGIMVGVFSKKFSIKKVPLLLLIAAISLLPVSLALFLNLPQMVSYSIIVASNFVIMGVATMITIQMLTFIQGETPTNLTGKVIASVMALSMCSQPLGKRCMAFYLITLHRLSI